MSSLIDVSALERLHKIGGDRLLIGMLDLFLANLPLRVGRILTGVESSDAAEVRQAAHSLKSTAANLGALQLSALGAEVELRAEQRDVATVAAMLTELQACADATFAALAAYRAGCEPAATAAGAP